MDKLKKCTLVGVLLVFACYVFYQKKNELSHIQFAETKEISEQDATQVLIQKHLAKFKSSQAHSFDQTVEGAYKRPQLKRRITAQDSSNILDKNYDESFFDEMVKVYAERDKVTEISQAVWDLNKKPETHEEMQLYLKEIRHVALAEVEDAILNDDRTKAVKFAGAHFGYTFLAVFDFKGYDDKGVVLIDLPVNLKQI